MVIRWNFLAGNYYRETGNSYPNILLQYILTEVLLVQKVIRASFHAASFVLGLITSEIDTIKRINIKRD